ncbi:hypothetical protein THAPSDRAFT_263036, partial [Thalassiosira pseudonana CCMP1335]
WDSNWDGRQPPSIGGNATTTTTTHKQLTQAQRDRHIRKNGITKHIILIRHGQYDETNPEDHKRLLTPLGRHQAALTGQRLGALIRGVNEEVSDLARAKETADIVYENMGLEGVVVEKAESDPLLNEGRPCHHIPGGKVRQSVIERTDEHHPRIEQAFRKYFYHSNSERNNSDNDNGTNETTTTNLLQPHPQHEFEIIVCHANVIRYFFCRALQLPPEAWLRLCTFNCSLTYFTIRPTGTVSCRMLGDHGHLPYDACT